MGVAPPTAQVSVATDCDGDAKFRYFDAVAGLLIEKSAERTVVVAIEDTHWDRSNAMPDKGFTKITVNGDKTAFAAYKHAVPERSTKHITYEWQADATHVWINVKGQSSAEEMSYNVDAGTLTFGPDAATQFVMHRENR